MNEIVVAFLGIALLFGTMVLIRSKYALQWCAICMAVGLTWLTLLILFWTGRFQNVTLLALLMGQSVVGVFYVVEKQVAEPWRLFRLPFLLTLTAAAYSVLALRWAVLAPVYGLLLVFWLGFLGVFLARANRTWKAVAQRLIDCCRGW